jgi:hypothetical protein
MSGARLSGPSANATDPASAILLEHLGCDEVQPDLLGEASIFARACASCGGKTVPVKTRMGLVKVTRKTLGDWARKLQGWGFSGVPEEYLKLE